MAKTIHKHGQGTLKQKGNVLNYYRNTVGGADPRPVHATAANVDDGFSSDGEGNNNQSTVVHNTSEIHAIPAATNGADANADIVTSKDNNQASNAYISQ